jgi:hypothetical protein
MGTSGVRSGGQYKYGVPETKTSFHYIQGSEPEAIVKQKAKSKYHITLDPAQKLYDLGNDHEKLVEQALKENNGAWNTDNIFKKIKDSGYHGIWAPTSDNEVIRNTVQLFNKHPVDKEEQL